MRKYHLLCARFFQENVKRLKLIFKHVENMKIACGGMDNMCTIYDVNNRDANGAAKIIRELAGYEGFLSSCRFLDDTHIVTGSGDMKICVWDLEAGKKTSEMDGHLGDVVRIKIIQKLSIRFLTSTE